VDVDRILANETAEAMDTVRDSRPLPSWLTRGTGLTASPTPEDHERAKEKFESEVETYEENLRAWLSEYSSASLRRWETFRMSLALSNATGAAHAEAVEVVLELPENVDGESADLQVEAPPVRPTYRPPQPRSLLPSAMAGWRGPSPVVSLRPEFDLDAVIPGLRSQHGWDESSDSRRLTAPRVELQPGRTVEIGEPLWLRAKGPGVHEIQWSVYSQSLGHPVRGSFKLVVPEGDPTRPPFGRIAGILRFPDAEIEREDIDADEAAEEGGEPVGSATRPIRSSDPPLAPPASDVKDGEADVLATLRETSRHWEWEALGLDPALDGPSSNRVEVRREDPQDPEG
jgi:hypothetical protein